MRQQKGRQGRKRRPDRRVYAVIRNGDDGLLSAVSVSRRYNAIYGMREFHRCMLVAALFHGFINQVATLLRAFGKGRAPTGLWVRRRMRATSQADLVEGLAESARRTLDACMSSKLAQRGITVAIDKTKYSRYDKNPGFELVRSKSKNGTTKFEAYISAQCVDGRARANLAALPMCHGDDNADFVRKIMAQIAQRGYRVRLVVLDREFYSRAIISELKRSGIDWLVPCPNKPRVVGAIREFAAGRRPRMSDSAVTDGRGRSEPYRMAITERKRKGKQKADAFCPDPEEKYIAFATNMDRIDPNGYAVRWGIETGYANLRSIRIRTTSRDPRLRRFCFYYAMMIYNAWIVARNPERGAGDGIAGGPLGLIGFVLIMSDILGYLRPPEPPPLGRR